MKTQTKPFRSCFTICLYPTFKEWKLITRSCHTLTPFSVYILPLRNENLFSRFKFIIRRWVYILPLRNENISNKLSFNIIILSLYPTFKEWKRLSFGDFDMPAFIRLYPTFKEWKRSPYTAFQYSFILFISYL